MIRGINLDPQTRCAHYHGPTDIIAIKMKCCREHYACKDCHDELADHPIKAWPQSEWNEKAILCGVCGLEMTIREYLESDYRCGACGAQFNPKCKNHHYYYFAVESD
ncbi:MAG TPA: CHY zinc finger protein [Candidatus Sulfotelmatobacter sp.]|nr:CHY zinc finger protein [Candidatus Sulfotelmatobacter sp.]